MSNRVRTSASDTECALDHHLGAFAVGIEELMRDYDESSVLITGDSTYSGIEEIRGFFQAFIDGAKPAFWSAFKLLKRAIVGEVAYLTWEAKPFVTLATDTIVVKDRKIRVQTFTAFTG